MNEHRYTRIFLRAALTSCAFLIVFCLFANGLTLGVASPLIHSVAEVTATGNDEYKSFDCIFVLGAGLRPDGTPSTMLADRLDTAAALYAAGVSKMILVSGDTSGDYDEVGAMSTYLMNLGIAPEAITEDHYGYSTGESVRNLAASDVYSRVLIVTQAYHLPRALYMAVAAGLDPIGVYADSHPYAGQTVRDLREFAARVKDVLVTAVS